MGAESAGAHPGSTAMDFMIVVVSALIGAAPVPAAPPGAVAALGPSAGAAAAVPQMQRHFSDELSCEQAANAAVAPPGARLVCIPIGVGGDLTAAY